MEQRPSRHLERSAHDEVLDIKDEVHYVHAGKRRIVRWRLVALLIVLVVGPTIIDLALGNPIEAGVTLAFGILASLVGYKAIGEATFTNRA